MELIRDHTLQTGQKGYVHERIIAIIDHHLVLGVPDVLDQIAGSKVVVKGQR